MDQTQIGLFDLAERRLAWIARRQAVLAQNIANANTPHFQPHDLKPFAAALSGMNASAPVRTQPNHLAGAAGGASQTEFVELHQDADGVTSVIRDNLFSRSTSSTVRLSIL